MATEVVKRLITVDEYYKMAEVGILKPDDRVELINGEIYEMSPVGSKHGSTVKKLNKFLTELLAQEAIIGVQDPVRLSENSEPEPDIAVLRYRSDFYSAAHPGPEDVLAIIEVANSSLKHDKEVKTPLYARHGIPVYWIIDIDKRQIEVYQKPGDGQYHLLNTYNEKDEVLLLQKSIQVKEILP